MPLAAWVSCAMAAATSPLQTQGPDGLSPDDLLRIYAVNVIHGRPFEEPFTGYGIHLGQGALLTAAHVLGRWPSFISNARVLIAGQEIPAKVIKDGSVGTIDLALLTVDETSLPISY